MRDLRTECCGADREIDYGLELSLGQRSMQKEGRKETEGKGRNERVSVAIHSIALLLHRRLKHSAFGDAHIKARGDS